MNVFSFDEKVLLLVSIDEKIVSLKERYNMVIGRDNLSTEIKFWSSKIKRYELLRNKIIGGVKNEN